MPRAKPPPSANPMRGATTAARGSRSGVEMCIAMSEARRLPITSTGRRDSFGRLGVCERSRRGVAIGGPAPTKTMRRRAIAEAQHLRLQTRAALRGACSIDQIRHRLPCADRMPLVIARPLVFAGVDNAPGRSRRSPRVAWRRRTAATVYRCRLTAISGLFATGWSGANELPDARKAPCPGKNVTPRYASTVPVDAGVRRLAAPVTANLSLSGI
jgi:hypothetical protein